MTSVILHGKLGKKFGKHHKFLIKKPIDAIKALMANKKGFYKAYKTWGREGKLYQIICDNKIIETNDELVNNKEIKEIHICPIIAGAGDNVQGIGQIIVGTLLIVVGVMTSNPYLINAGIAIAVGGVMSILFPPPTPTFESNVQSKSFLFSSTENSTVQGVPVPIGYGRLRVGSKVISTSLQPKRLRGSGVNFPFKAERNPDDLKRIQDEIDNKNMLDAAYSLGLNLALDSNRNFRNLWQGQNIINSNGNWEIINPNEVGI